MVLGVKMLPIKLTMQAFGAYLKKTEIPFSNLGSSNIYLICGPCGSGKTTIFDAICFALFNSSSTATRGNLSLRSHYAPQEILSFVEFEFLFNGEKYKITRSPSYERKKTKGEGVVVEPQRAQIQLPNGKLIIGVKEVDEFVLELLGVNKNQFSQIALLAQGEFLKLLNSDTKTRGEIFRNIFKTSNCLDFQLNLKEKTLNYKQDLEIFNSNLLNSLSMLDYSDKINALVKQYTENSNFDSLGDFIRKINQENKLESGKKLILDKKIEQLNLVFIEKQKELEKIKNKIDLINQLDCVKKEIVNQKRIFSPVKKKYLSLDTKQQKLDNLRIEFQSLSDDFEKIDKIKNLKLNLSNKKNELGQINSQLKQNEKKLIETKKEQLNFCYQTYLELKNELKTKKQEFLSCQKEFIIENCDYEKKYQIYLSNQVGILANLLKDDHPCPVCGSWNHPNKAVVKNKEITKELVDNLRKKVRTKEELLNQLSSTCAIFAQKVDNKKNEFELLKNRYKLTFTKKNPLKINYQEKLDEISSVIDKIKTQKEKLNIEIAQIESGIETLGQELKNPKIIINNYKKIKNEIEFLKNLIKSIRLDYNRENSLLENYLSKKELLESQIKELSIINTKNLTKIEGFVEKAKLDISTLRLEYQNLSVKHETNLKMTQKIEFYYEQYKETKEIYSHYKILSDCANGTLKGKPRVAFEQYIQGYYLDLVLSFANKIFKVITNNQFELFRKRDPINLGLKTGLDLEVLDYHTYKKRDTKTLSGGESFKAALSLALGLSQCVSNFSGAINIDALFIDEGFGSLDSESLDCALDVIFNLTNNNRLIGLISHVNDLKLKIPNQIVTKKSPFGSCVEITF